MLRNMPPVKFVFARLAALLRSDRVSDELPVTAFVEDAAAVTQTAIEPPAAVLGVSEDIVATELESDNRSELEELVCRPSPLLDSDGASEELPVSGFPDEALVVTPEATDQPVAVLEVSEDIVVAEPEPDQRSERERLIRRRWSETGIKMWNPDIHGAGRAALNIQGRVGVLPARPGERLPAYDKLEFRWLGGQIRCEGVGVDPPARRK
jgi:hypothetical protein